MFVSALKLTVFVISFGSVINDLILQRIWVASVEVGNYDMLSLYGNLKCRFSFVFYIYGRNKNRFILVIKVRDDAHNNKKKQIVKKRKL